MDIRFPDTALMNSAFKIGTPPGIPTDLQIGQYISSNINAGIILKPLVSSSTASVYYTPIAYIHEPSALKIESQSPQWKDVFQVEDDYRIEKYPSKTKVLLGKFKFAGKGKSTISLEEY